MKKINSEQQLLIIAKEEIYKLFRSIPAVKDVIIRNGFEGRGLVSDFIIEIFTEYKKVELFADIKSRGEKRFIIEYAGRVKSFIDNSRCMIIAPYISPDSAELLKENGVNYMDLSGNCYVAADNFMEISDNEEIERIKQDAYQKVNYLVEGLSD